MEVSQWTVSDAAIFLFKTASTMSGMPREYVFRALVEIGLRTPRITGKDRALTVADARALPKKERTLVQAHLCAVLEAVHRLQTRDDGKENLSYLFAALAYAFMDPVPVPGPVPGPTPGPTKAGAGAGAVPAAMPYKPSLANISPRLAGSDDVLDLMYSSGVVRAEAPLDFTVVLETIFSVPNWLFPHARYARREARDAFAASSPDERTACLRLLLTFLERLRVSYGDRTGREVPNRAVMVPHVSAFFDLSCDAVESVAAPLFARTAGFVTPPRESPAQTLTSR